MKVIGIVNSQGDYEGRHYHNLVLQVETENTNANKDVCGLLADTVKLRYSDLNTLFNMGFADPADVEKLTAKDFKDILLNAEVDVAYNKFGAVQSVTILREPPKSEPNSATKQGSTPAK